jgi:hypothetical protein
MFEMETQENNETVAQLQHLLVYETWEQVFKVGIQPISLTPF